MDFELIGHTLHVKSNAFASQRFVDIFENNFVDHLKDFFELKHIKNVYDFMAMWEFLKEEFQFFMNIASLGDL